MQLLSTGSNCYGYTGLNISGALIILLSVNQAVNNFMAHEVK